MVKLQHVHEHECNKLQKDDSRFRPPLTALHSQIILLRGPVDPPRGMPSVQQRVALVGYDLGLRMRRLDAGFLLLAMEQLQSVNTGVSATK